MGEKQDQVRSEFDDNKQPVWVNGFAVKVRIP